LISKQDLKLCEALGLDPKLLTQEVRQFDFPLADGFTMYKHNKSSGDFFMHRTACIKDYARSKASQMYGFNGKWVEAELFEFEKENLLHIQMVESQKARWRRR